MKARGQRESGTMGADRRVLLGAITGAHGVRGQVTVKPFTADPDAIAGYGALEDEPGERRFEIEITGRSRGLLIARITEIEDRDAAEALKGTRLYVARDALPEAGEDEFYHADLIGLAVDAPHGAALGRIKTVQDFGAGALLEIELADGGTVYLPFTLEAVPVVDLEAARIVLGAPLEQLTVGE